MKNDINTYINELKNYCTKYELNNINEKLNELQNSELNVSIAFLGEFSSGKSTLINALIGQELLPSMAEPTTKNIIKIIPKKGINEIKFYLETDDSIEEIEPTDFQEYAFGEKKGNTIIEVPASEKLPEGFIFIDTPGISSLDKTDADITFGYLPFIDGAVICQDINFGGFTNSVIKFLKENIPDDLRNKFIFALTKSDTKPESEVKKIKENAINTLKEVGYKDAENRVAVCSPLKYLETKDEKYLKKFKDILKSQIISKKSELEKYRKKKKLEDIANSLIEGLVNLKSNSSLDLSDIDKEIEETEKKIEQLKKKRQIISDRLLELKDSLRSKYEKALMSKIPDFKEVSDKEKISEIVQSLSSELQAITEKRIRRFLKSNFSTESEEITLPEINREIERSINRILAIAETIKLAITMGIFTALPGGGIYDVIQAGGGWVFKKVLKSKNGVAGKFSKFFKEIDLPGKVIDFGAKKLIESKLRGKFPQLAEDLSEAVIEELREILEETFNEIDDEMRNYTETMITLRKEKLQKYNEFKNFLSELEGDIKILEAMKEDIRAIQ